MANDHVLQEGDLLAYLDGVRDPYVMKAIEQSPAIQARLAELADAERMFRVLFAGAKTEKPVPLPFELPSRLWCQLTAPPIQTVLAAPWQRMETQTGVGLRGVEIPPHVGDGLRRSPSAPLSQIYPGQSHLFVAQAVMAEVTVRFKAVSAETWGIDGHVTQHFEPIPDVQIVLYRRGRGRYTTQTDEDGMFAFQPLPAGRYRIHVLFSHGTLVLPKLVLRNPDPEEVE